MQVYRFPVLRDNYLFLLYDPELHIAAAVDPAEPEPVLSQLHAWQADLVAIFNTHHHYDHVGANQALVRQFPEAVVYGGANDRGRIPEQKVFLYDGDQVQFGSAIGEVIFVPGHTKAHIAYYFAATGDLFCGDTLFGGGCGRLFEGTPAQMRQSLERLRELPDSTRIWCAHEYTLNNLEFALTIEPDNLALQERFLATQNLRAQNLPTIPSSMKVEKATNPFLRWDQPGIQKAMAVTEPDRVLARLRGKKDQF
ncbi:MAG: hydroxyacylglutathione hydrolase [Pseudanabaenaceae cyanobacterium]|jgi:hydroxyacylglutathione hydrolase